MKNKFRLTLISWNLVSCILPRKRRSASLRCFKCQKYGHHREACRGRQTYTKCGEKDPDHLEEDCLKQIRCANRRQDPSAYVRSCDVYKKEKEILVVKHERNVSFLEAREIVETNMRENSYASVTRIAQSARTVEYTDCFYVEGSRENSRVTHGKNSYASVILIYCIRTLCNKYRAFVEKLIQLEPNDLIKF